MSDRRDGDLNRSQHFYSHFLFLFLGNLNETNEATIVCHQQPDPEFIRKHPRPWSFGNTISLTYRHPPAMNSVNKLYANREFEIFSPPTITARRHAIHINYLIHKLEKYDLIFTK